jgi:hypothetical protein
MTYKMFNNAHVAVTKLFDAKHRPLTHIVIDGECEHTFPHNSRVSRHLDVMEAHDLANILTGGSFFTIENQLVDMRDSRYSGFVHNPSTIDAFMDTLGYQLKEDLDIKHLKKTNDEVQSQIVLRKIWNNNEISVPGYAHGADFNSVLSFGWNPFVKTVNTMLDIIRQICTNGMVGLTSFLNTKVPVINRWDDHLDIAARQIQNKVNDIVTTRVKQMTLEHASVGDLLLLEDHVMKRIETVIETVEHNRLFNIMNAVSPRIQLQSVYRDSVFDDKNLAAQLPGHLSAFDAWNIATELRTHTAENAKSTDHALDKIANALLFDKQDNFDASLSRFSMPSKAAFSDAEVAFFGQIVA